MLHSEYVRKRPKPKPKKKNTYVCSRAAKLALTSNINMADIRTISEEIHSTLKLASLSAFVIAWVRVCDANEALKSIVIGSAIRSLTRMRPIRCTGQCRGSRVIMVHIVCDQIDLQPEVSRVPGDDHGGIKCTDFIIAVATSQGYVSSLPHIIFLWICAWNWVV